MDAAGDTHIKMFKINPDSDDITQIARNKPISLSQFKISKVGKKISDAGRQHDKKEKSREFDPKRK